MLANKQRLSLAEALPLLKEIGAALDYSHSAKPAVIHRDLKPLNILLTKQGQVKVADFGLARVLRDSASRISGGDSAGTLAYMAPEQIRGKNIGRHSDIYALAAIGYELLSGMPPFYTGDLRWQIIHEEAEPLADQPDAVNHALMAGLAKDKDSRPSSAAEFIKMLTDTKAKPEKPPEATLPRHSKPPRRLEPKKKRRSSVIGGKWFLVLLGMIVLAGLGYGVYSNQEQLSSLVTQASHLIAANDSIKTTMVTSAKQEDKSAIYGSLNITSVPSGATVYVDGKKSGTTPYHSSQTLVGTREVELRIKGYDSLQRFVDIAAQTEKRLKLELNRASGILKVSSVPSGAKVYINGNEAGKTTYIDEVEAGEILVSVTSPFTNTDWKKVVEVMPDRTNEVIANLTPSSFKDPITGMEFVYIKGGCYQMGDAFGDVEYHDAEPIHNVCVKDFYMGKYEVTQGEWTNIMENNPSDFKNGDRYPVEQVSWDDTQAYIKKLNRKSGKNYRLPTEAEWEYAAREGGKKVRFGNGKNIIDPKEANFRSTEDCKESYSHIGIYRGSTVPVDSFSPNALGLYNMSGNVSEWCQDKIHYGYKNAPTDGTAWETDGAEHGMYRIFRGGGWQYIPSGLLAANRGGKNATHLNNTLGFRLALSVNH